MWIVVLDIAMILGLVSGAFIAGMKLSDKYHAHEQAMVNYALQKQYARLKAGVDADDVGQPYVPHPEPKYKVSSEFMEHLKKNKCATMQL